jgi:hypothetical protein
MTVRIFDDGKKICLTFCLSSTSASSCLVFWLSYLFIFYSLKQFMNITVGNPV